ncbi:hypothetical protein HYALB_00000991 [Hymenoscyphus albidus]|uniref:Uncharacterized protein n=1 Tax=Hymenoscyphus albidus TaxID=595503 RepID=A0A9N9Q7F4_9HELO|nr:hypothetical protein HYALB_00000991 [Hymenoscyphus albidus]
MTTLRDRLAVIESALQDLQTLEITERVRQSLDHRFDKTPPDIDAAPFPTPAQEKPNPFDQVSGSKEKEKFYDTIAAKFGLGFLATEDFSEYVVYNAFVTNLRVCPVDLTDSGNYYYLEHRFWLPNTPGVVLRKGSDKEGECLGVANIPLTGRNCFGVGDFAGNPGDVLWETLRVTGFWTHMRYEFEIGPPSDRRVFHWIRTRNNIMDDQGDLVLIEKEKEDRILAEYVGKGLLKWKKRGRLRIKNTGEYGGSWEKVVLLTWAAIIELSRRRARYRRYSPSHIIHG